MSPGKQRGVRQIDRLGAGRRGDARRRPGGLDPLAAHDHGPAVVHRLAVEHAGRMQEIRRGALRVLRAATSTAAALRR